MTASYEAREQCPVPSMADCLKAMKEASVAVQQRRAGEGRSDEDGAPASGAALQKSAPGRCHGRDAGVRQETGHP